MFSLTLVSFLLCLSIVIILWQRRRFYYASFKMRGPYALPLLGNIEIARDILQKFLDFRKKYGSTFRLWLGTTLTVCITKPEDFVIILNSSNALRKADPYDLITPILGQGIFHCRDVSRWRSNRKLIASTLNQRTLNGFIPIVEKNSSIFCQIIKTMVGRGFFDVQYFLHHCHLDIICESTLGLNLYAQREENEYFLWCSRLTKITMERMFSVWLFPDIIFKNTNLGKEQEKIIKSLRNLTREVIQTKRKEYKHLKEFDVKNKTFLQCLMETKRFTDEELIDEVATFTFAGTDTSALMESFVLMMLGMHPEVQAKVFEEQQAIFGDSDRSVSINELNQMIYLERVIKETMRLFPVGPLFGRKCTEDVKLSHCTLPAGSDCILLVFYTHRDPKLWKDPLKFDPERFLPEEVAKRHPYSWIPFAAGPRNCLGLNYAMMMMKTLLSIVVRKYIISCGYNAIEDIQVKQEFLINAINGFQISVELRK